MDLRAWKVFRSVDHTILVVGKGEVGLLVMHNEDVLSVGSGHFLGYESIHPTKLPTKIVELSGLKIKGIYAGGDSAFVLTHGGQLFTWGQSDHGQLGLGKDVISVKVPTLLKLPGAKVVTEVASSEGHTVVLTACGQIYSWGSNEMWQVRPTPASKVWTPKSVQLEEDETEGGKVETIACNTWSSFALTTNGKVWVWGSNYIIAAHGPMTPPTCIPIVATITKVVCGASNALMLDSAGSLHFWEQKPPGLQLDPIEISGVMGAETADTKLIVNEQDTIYVHKAILTCMSDFFKTMFKGNYWEETGVPSRVQEVQIKKVDPGIFRRFVKYLYNGSLDHEILRDDEDECWSKLLDLMGAADRFCHLELAMECAMRLVPLVRAENVMQIFLVANKLDFKDLEEKALKLLAPQFHEILESDIGCETKALIADKLSLLGYFQNKSESPLPSSAAGSSPH